MSGCRIKSVRLKSGGEIRLLPPPSPPDEGRDGLVRSAAKMASWYKDGELKGYAMVAWAADGAYNVSYYSNKDGVVGCGLMPSFVADALRRRMIEEGDWQS